MHQLLCGVLYSVIPEVDMEYWRMKLRAGSHGPDMWPACKKASVAAIAKGSLSYFAWEIAGGDAIYVADSLRKEIVGMGYARAPIGELAYRFDKNSPIVDPDGEWWRHLIDVDWDQTYVPFVYEHPRAALHMVLKLNPQEIEIFERATQEYEHRQSGLSKKEVENTLLLETAYPRYTPAALRLISRKHAVLSNHFKCWLDEALGIHAQQERQQIDATFDAGGKGISCRVQNCIPGEHQESNPRSSRPNS